MKNLKIPKGYSESDTEALGCIALVKQHWGLAYLFKKRFSIKNSHPVTEAAEYVILRIIGNTMAKRNKEQKDQESST